VSQTRRSPLVFRMRLLTFVPPDRSVARVGLLSRDGTRVVDLTAIGIEDMFDALAQAPRLRRVGAHLVHAPGALAYRTADVELLAPLPVARTAWARAESVIAARRAERGGGRALAIVSDATPPEVDYADPMPLLGPGAAVEAHGPLAALDFGVACVMSGGGDAGWATRDPEQGVAGYCGVLRWAAPRTGGALARGAALGPWLVTPDDLADRRSGPVAHDLSVALAVNGVERYREERGAERQPRLAHVIAAAAGAFTLRAGDVLCLVRPARPGTGGELPGPRDEVVLHIERLGALSLRVTPAATDPVAKGE